MHPMFILSTMQNAAYVRLNCGPVIKKVLLLVPWEMRFELHLQLRRWPVSNFTSPYKEAIHLSFPCLNNKTSPTSLPGHNEQVLSACHSLLLVFIMIWVFTGDFSATSSKMNISALSIAWQGESCVIHHFFVLEGDHTYHTRSPTLKKGFERRSWAYYPVLM